MMPIEVITISTCNLCGSKDQRSGAEATIPPVNWGAVKLVERLAGAGWTNNIQNDYDCVCPTCYALVKKFLIDTILNYKGIPGDAEIPF